jgi:hypothetical protein
MTEFGGQFQECWPFPALLLAHAPSPRVNFSSAFSPVTNRLIIYGGEDVHTKQIYSEVLLLQTKPSKMWLRLPPPPNSKALQPPPLTGNLLHFDMKRALFSCFGHFWMHVKRLPNLLFFSVSILPLSNFIETLKFELEFLFPSLVCNYLPHRRSFFPIEIIFFSSDVMHI